MAKIAVYFPGIGYTVDKPLLYYGKQLARKQGFTEERNIVYQYVNKENIRGNEQKMREVFEELYRQAEEQLSEINWTEYDEILFVSKSIGTIVSAFYEQAHHLSNVRQILYTPLKYTFDYPPEEAISFIGDADPWSDIDEMIHKVDLCQIPQTVYSGCNHSLECYDTHRNIGIMEDVMKRTEDFLLERKMI